MKSGMCEFTSTKEDLAKGVYRLICSLGIKAGISKSDAKIYGRKTSDRWRITFKTSKKVFRLKRKLDRIPKKHSIRQDFRSIVKWEDIQSIPVKCIQVDSPNKMYLFGDGFIPTHNTTFVLFMMTTMSLETSWKWVIWSPEMKSANIVDGKVKVNYNTIAYEIMAILSGKTPYKHLAEKYQIPFMTFEEIEMHKEWIDMHFIFLDPEKKDIKSMYNTLNVIWKDQGFDGILIDPFKNIEKETIKREDQHLHDVFAEFKDFAIRTDVSMNWIAHPRSGVSRISHDGQLNPCNQYMLAGGAAWDNSMDGIYSVLRPDSLDDISSPRVRFYNLKQRMSELVAQRGEVDDIEFDIRTRRYNFKSIEPLKF